MTSSNSGNGDDPVDVAALTRLANEFMRAGLNENVVFSDLDTVLKGQTGTSAQLVPGEAELRQLPSTMGAVNPGSAGVPPASVSMPASGFFAPTVVPTAMPAVVPAGSVLPVPSNPGALPAMPSRPGMPSDFQSLVQMPSDPTFGFLNEIRPLFALASESANLPASALSVDALTDDSYLKEFSRAVEDLTNLSAPQMPGAVAHPNIQQGADYYSFSQMRQMPRIDVIPVLEPMSVPQSAGLSNFNFSGQNFDVAAIRRDFPILQEQINGHSLVWLDNAATTQKPQSVIDRLNYFYTHENSNIHRAAHELAARSTDAYEAARESVRRFLNASSANEVIFVRGATEAINLVAQSWGRQNVGKDDEIVITWLEHHANIVPWQMLCAEKGARLRVAPVDDHGQIILDEYERLLGPRTRLVSLAQVSNALGTVTPINEMVAAAHRHGARVLVDGAQAVSHMRVDVQEYDCDFYVFSGHKLFAPTGIGVVYGKEELLNSMRPWQGGGNMIKDVTFERTTYQSAPVRFEAGTGSIADAVGLGAAVEYLERIGMVNITRHENELMAYGTQGLKSIPGLHLIGTAPEKAGILSFVLDGFRTEEVSSALNQQGIAVRAGHHCAQPILRRFGLESTVRPSLALYNTCEDIDALIAAIWNLKQGRGPGPL